MKVKCNICGKELEEQEAVKIKSNYCPVCGARMDKVTE